MKTRIKRYLLILLLNLPVITFAISHTTFNPQGFMNKMLNNLMGDTSTWQTIFVPTATAYSCFYQLQSLPLILG